jgi:hypothetical protein
MHSSSPQVPQLVSGRMKFESRLFWSGYQWGFRLAHCRFMPTGYLLYFRNISHLLSGFVLKKGFHDLI